MEYIRNTFRMLVGWFTMGLSIWWGSTRMNKWVKKNKKEQNPNLYSFNERFEYLRKKSKGVTKRMGIIVKVEGLENIPKGGAWIVPNHTSNLDSIYLPIAFGGKTEIVPVAKESLNDKKIAGKYMRGIDAMFLDTDSPRQALTLLTGAAQYAKTRNRSVVVFPEGTRSFTTELLDFKNGTFKFPQKYFLPIIPVTITGTLQAKKFFKFKSSIVTVNIHEPIKPINHSKKPTEVVGRQIKDIMQKTINKYEASLSEKELDYLNKLKKQAIEDMKKKEDKMAQRKQKAKEKEAKEAAEVKK